MTKTGADFIQVARIAVSAIAADDRLVDALVLKGGTALQLIHQVGARASQDLDFSMEGDGEDESQLMDRLWTSLRDRFDAANFMAFDFRFEPRPTRRRDEEPRWGGYNAWIRVVKRDVEQAALRKLAMKYKTPDEERKRQALIGLSTEVKIEISKWEYVQGNELMEIGDLGLSVRVYTPAMIAAEKLRALCQQMDGQRRNPTSRARDFYDIHALVTGRAQVDFRQNAQQELVRAMFAVKEVPLKLLGNLGLEKERERHRTSWDQVRNAVTGEQLKEFDEYFDFVVNETRKLEPLWIANTPG